MEDVIEIPGDVDLFRDIVIYELEPVVLHQMTDVVHRAGKEIVETNDRMPFTQQAVAKM